MTQNYYLVEIDTVLTDDTVDGDGVVTEIGTKNLAKNALLELGRLTGLPHTVTHLRPSLDGQKIIVEMQLAEALTKSEACDKLAELLPWTSQQISDNTSFTKFAGDNWESRRVTAVQYIIDNVAEWEE